MGLDLLQIKALQRKLPELGTDVQYRPLVCVTANISTSKQYSYTPNNIFPNSNVLTIKIFLLLGPNFGQWT